MKYNPNPIWEYEKRIKDSLAYKGSESFHGSYNGKGGYNTLTPQFTISSYDIK